MDELRGEDEISISTLHNYDIVGNKKDIEIYKEGFRERNPDEEVEFNVEKLNENLYGIRAKFP